MVHEEADTKIEVILRKITALLAMYWLSLRVWIALLFRLWSAWLPFPALGIWFLSCILTGERSVEPYLDYIM